MEDSDTVFDRVLHSVGDDGKFQRRTNIIFTFFLGVFSTMVYMSIILALDQPDHWCHVPGNEKGKYTLEQWKNMTLPMSIDAYNHKITYSSCEMYNDTKMLTGLMGNSEFDTQNVTTCQFGYEYDNTWYNRTISSSQDWVCDKSLYVSNLFAAAKVAEGFGVIIFGYIGDTFGRRIAFLISLAIMFTGRFASAFLTSWYPLFVIASVISSIPCTTAAQACLVIILELSPAEDRAFLVQLQNIAWMTGLCLLPFFGWILKDAVIYIIVTTVPLLAFFPLSLYIVESPRWLLGRGRVAECLQQLQVIAKVNGTRLSPESALMLQNTFIAPEKVYGIPSLFSSWRMAKNACLMTICWTCCMLSYNTLSLNVTSMSGNPFLNFFLQSLAELPSYVIGKVLSDWLGRRLTSSAGFLLSGLGFIPVILLLDDPNTVWLQSILLFISKSFITITYFTSALQTFEMYPTNVRQSGVSLGMWSGNVISILGPYIVYMGLSYTAKFPYYIIAALCVLGTITEIFLPETLHEKLPETLQEAQRFGEDQSYWSRPRKHKDLYVLANLNMSNINRHMNSEHYDPEDNKQN